MRLLRKLMQPWRVSQTLPSVDNITNLEILMPSRELSLEGQAVEAGEDITSIAVTFTNSQTMTLSTLKNSSTSCFSAISPKAGTEGQPNNSKDNSSIGVSSKVSKLRTLGKQ